MRNLFRLKYNMTKNEDKTIHLDKDINIITVDDLRRIGLYMQHDKKEKIFTILKNYDKKGLITWKILNNTDRDMYINLKESHLPNFQVVLHKGEYEGYIFKNLTEEKIYFNQMNSGWDYLFIDKIKIPDENSKRTNKSDEPMDVNFDEISALLVETETINEGVLNKCEENNKNEILNEENLAKLLEEIQDDLVGGSHHNFGNAVYNTLNNKKIIELKNEQKFEMKNKKIIFDEDEECQVSCNKQTDKTALNTLNLSEISNNKLNMSNINSTVTSKNNKDNFLDESELNSILEKYQEEMMNERYEKFEKIMNNQRNENKNPNIKCTDNIQTSNLPTYISLESKKRKEDFIKSVSKFGGEFNSNEKRPRQYKSGNKEQEEFFSGIKTKRLKKALDNKELKLDLNASCAICLENINELANLDNCNHDFCKPCIVEWSTKYTNLCPLCKKEFKKIIYYDKNKKKEMKVKKKKLEIEEEGLEFYEYAEASADECMKCGLSNDFSNLLVCDSCHYNVCHTYCDGLTRIPDNDWFCSECKEAVARVNLFRDMWSGNLEEYDEDEDEEYSPRIILEDEDEDVEQEYIDLDELEKAFILDEDEGLTIRRRERSNNRNIRNSRSNRNSNISLNIHVNFNMRNRNSRTNSNTSRNSNSSRTATRNPNYNSNNNLPSRRRNANNVNSNLTTNLNNDKPTRSRR